MKGGESGKDFGCRLIVIVWSILLQVGGWS